MYIIFITWLADDNNNGILLLLEWNGEVELYVSCWV